MINPNAIHKGKDLGVIIEIEPENMPLRQIKIKTDSGHILTGLLNKVHSYPNTLTVGQRVGYTIQYSIMNEAYRLESVIKKRGVK